MRAEHSRPPEAPSATCHGQGIPPAATGAIWVTLALVRPLHPARRSTWFPNR